MPSRPGTAAADDHLVDVGLHDDLGLGYRCSWDSHIVLMKECTTTAALAAAWRPGLARPLPLIRLPWRQTRLFTIIAFSVGCGAA